jgi:hypothetical protein
MASIRFYVIFVRISCGSRHVHTANSENSGYRATDVRASPRPIQRVALRIDRDSEGEKNVPARSCAESERNTIA